MYFKTQFMHVGHKRFLCTRCGEYISEIEYLCGECMNCKKRQEREEAGD